MSSQLSFSSSQRWAASTASLLLLGVGFGQLEQAGERGEVGEEGFCVFGAQPEDGLVVFALAMSVLGGGLGLAHSAEAGEGEAAGLLQRGLEVGKLVGAFGEEGVLGEGDGEDARSQCGMRSTATSTAGNTLNSAHQSVNGVGVVNGVRKLYPSA